MATGLIRQGDVLLVPIDEFPFTGLRTRRVKKKDGDVIVAAGEVTGHHHRIKTDRVQMYRDGGEFYLKVPKGGADLSHEEHETLEIPEGKYRVDNQREYVPQAAPVRVYD